LLSVGLSQAESDEHPADEDEEEDEDDEVIEGDPNHNRGLNNAVRWVLHMAAESRASRPDIQVLGAIVAMEAWLDGPEMMPKYGRERGTCSRPVCSNEACWDALTPFFKAPVAEPVGEGMFCPMTNTLEPLRNLLGLTLEELVALQGAHSVGGVIVCSGLGNVAAGPYCPERCGLPPGQFWETGNFDGTAFDDTPGKLDNRYYQLLMDESYEGVPSCDEINGAFPQLSKRGFRFGGDMSVGDAGTTGQDRTEQCQVGVAFEDENQCEVEACVEECARGQECQEAQDIDNDDVEAYREGHESCNLCKKMCSGKYRRQLGRDTQRETLQQCRDDCSASTDCVESADYNNGECGAACRAERDACNEEAGASGFRMGECMSPCQSERNTCREPCESMTGRERRDCRRACNTPFNNCRSACQDLRSATVTCRDTVFAPCNEVCSENNAQRQNCRTCRRGCAEQANQAMLEIDNRTGLELRPTSWCKRMSEVKECLDTTVTLPINGGWGDCPEGMRMTHPNLGQGRLTVVQNVERWTTFRGLHKRVMVLPSDWSYLGSPETKALFQRYGTDEDAWKEQYVAAFTKVSEKGWEGQLSACQTVECAVSEGRITCPVAHERGVGNGQSPRATARMQERRAAVGLAPFVRPSSLEFPLAECEPALPEAPESCQLVGGYGLKAKLQCGDTLTYCLTAAAVSARAMINTEWESGGKEPTCPDGDIATLQAKRKSARPVRRLRSFRGASFIQSHAGVGRMDGMLEDDLEEDEVVALGEEEFHHAEL